jgi:DNA-directed RNA polymerase alpha subunit
MNKPTEAEFVAFLKDLLSHSEAQVSRSPQDAFKVKEGRARCMSKAKELLFRLEPQAYKTDVERSITCLDLPVRMSNVLVNAGILTVADVLKCSKHELSKLPGCGRNSLNALVTALAEYGELDEYPTKRSPFIGWQPSP